jgi:hypothetical protein
MNDADSLLIEATQKLIELSANPEWAIQLPLRSPPVLWFGNSISKKGKMLTFGANPSRSEYLLDNADQAMEKSRTSGNQSLLRYLEPPRNRFHLLSDGERMETIFSSPALREQIVAAYNTYFARNPYKIWFGDDKSSSYKVEGFLRGFGGSYYEGDAPLQAIHIDLFPFATLADFGKVKQLVGSGIFENGWAQGFVRRLVEFLSPTVVVVFGRTNCNYFAEYIDPSLGNMCWIKCLAGKYFVGRSERLGLPVVGLSTNLGNPRGFTSETLGEFGKCVRQAVHF